MTDPQKAYETGFLFRSLIAAHVDWDGDVDLAEEWTTYDLRELVRLTTRVLELRAVPL